MTIPFHWAKPDKKTLPFQYANDKTIIKALLCSPPPMCHVTHAICHMSGVRCQMSGVRCQVSIVTCQLPPNHKTQRAEILREGSPPPTCHMSPVTYHMSCVTCHVSHVTYFISFFSNVMKLFGGGSVINGAYPVLFIQLYI